MGSNILYLGFHFSQHHPAMIVGDSRGMALIEEVVEKSLKNMQGWNTIPDSLGDSLNFSDPRSLGQMKKNSLANS